MVRENEKECLNRLINGLKGKEKNNLWSNCDVNVMSQFIFTAQPNINSNKFPDFIFAGGGIEHFEVTSSKESKKGSQFKIDKNKNKSKKEKYYKDLEKEFASLKKNVGEVYISNYEEIYDDFSYEDFLISFEKNIKKHSISAEKSGTKDKNIIFLIEQQSGGAFTLIDGWRAKPYELHRDKRALNIIKTFCKFTDYLIYMVADNIEFIDLSKIDELIEKSFEYKNLKVGRVVHTEINFLL